MMVFQSSEPVVNLQYFVELQHILVELQHGAGLERYGITLSRGVAGAAPELDDVAEGLLRERGERAAEGRAALGLAREEERLGTGAVADRGTSECLQKKGWCSKTPVCE